MDPAAAPEPIEARGDPEEPQPGGWLRRLLGRLAVGLWILLYLPVSFCLVLWMTHTEVLVAAASPGDGRVLACMYFTGAGVQERRHVREAGSDTCQRFIRGQTARGAGGAGSSNQGEAHGDRQRDGQ